MNRLIQTSILAAAALTLTPAIADEGAYEISPLCVATGCFDGDGPGFPVTILQSGRYILTGNLDVSGDPSPENVTGISVETSANVSIDLNGFEIRGPVSCTGDPVSSCSFSDGTGSGIQVNINSGNVAIRNGSITGMGSDGIRCKAVGSRCRIEGMTLSQNRLNGLDAGGQWAVVRNTQAHSNGVTGLSLASGSVRDASATGNGDRGISANTATLESITSTGNGGDGIGSSGVVEHSTANFNGGDGINCFGCQANFNRAALNTGYGIDFGTGSLFGGNRLLGNTLGDANFFGQSTETLPNFCADPSC